MKGKVTTVWWIVGVVLLTACIHHKPVGKRVFIAKGNISFVLPDSSLKYSKLARWGPCCVSCSYKETNGFFHNRDTTMMVSVSVTVFPDSTQRTLQWKSIADEKKQRYVISVKNRGLAVIEHFRQDSSARAVDIEYHLPKRPEPGRFGQASYARSLVFYGSQRTVKLFFQGPDEHSVRQSIANTRASMRINSVYLQAGIKPYLKSEYLE